MTHAEYLETMAAIDAADACRRERRRIAKQAGTPEAKAAIRHSDYNLRNAKGFLGGTGRKDCFYWLDYKRALRYMQAAAGELVGYAPAASPLLEVLCSEA